LSKQVEQVDAEVAFEILVYALFKEENAKKKELAGNITASWGDQMRSYVLAPYQMVKDLRTNHEVNSPQAVFDGDLDGFIAAGIRHRKQKTP
jgi:peptide chain release factor 2